MNSSSSGSAPSRVEPEAFLFDMSFSRRTSSKRDAISGGAPTCNKKRNQTTFQHQQIKTQLTQKTENTGFFPKRYISYHHNPWKIETKSHMRKVKKKTRKIDGSFNARKLTITRSTKRDFEKLKQQLQIQRGLPSCNLNTIWEKITENVKDVTENRDFIISWERERIRHRKLPIQGSSWYLQKDIGNCRF